MLQSNAKYTSSYFYFCLIYISLFLIAIGTRAKSQRTKVIMCNISHVRLSMSEISNNTVSLVFVFFLIRHAFVVDCEFFRPYRIFHCNLLFRLKECIPAMLWFVFVEKFSLSLGLSLRAIFFWFHRLELTRLRQWGVWTPGSNIDSFWLRLTNLKIETRSHIISRFPTIVFSCFFYEERYEAFCILFKQKYICYVFSIFIFLDSLFGKKKIHKNSTWKTIYSKKSAIRINARWWRQKNNDR